MNILVTGDREWKDSQIIEVILRGVYEVIDDRDETMTLIHGDARGADKLSGEAAEMINHGFRHLRLADIEILSYPADWDKLGKAAGVIRNQDMLDKNKIDLAFAFHNNIEESKGTGDMVERLKRNNIPTYLIQRVS